jgi:putative transcriptional regulator
MHRRLGLTQEQFARRFQIAVGMVRDWEQGVYLSDSAATAYLRVIAHNPDAVEAALRASVPAPDRQAAPTTIHHG